MTLNTNFGAFAVPVGGASNVGLQMCVKDLEFA